MSFNVGGTNANVNAQQINFSSDGTQLVTSGAPGSKTLYVDGSRTSVPTPVGSQLLPFATIMDAVNQVAANGDNGTYPYVINIAAGLYAETIDLSNSNLVNLVFQGGNGVIVGNSSLSDSCVKAVNNDNLLAVIFVGVIFQLNASGVTHGIQFSSTTGNTELGRNGIIFRECGLQDNVGDVYFNNVSFIQFDNTGITANINATNVNNIDFVNGNGPNPQTPFTITTNTGTPTPNNWVGYSRSNFIGVGIGAVTCDALSQVLIGSCEISGTITTSSTSFFIIANSFLTGSIVVEAHGILGLVNCIVAQLGSGPAPTVSISGDLLSALTYITNIAITVNSGGALLEDGGLHDDGKLTVNSGGAYTAQGSMGVGTLALSEHLNNTPGNADMAGVITINASASQASFTFANAYASEPVVIVTPLNDVTALGAYWVTASATGFTINLHTVVISGSVEFNYVVIGNPN